jgi:prophage tail gpP-like protein
MSGAFSTDRVTLTVNGVRYSTWRELAITRDLREITGKFTLRYFDAGRAAAAMPPGAGSPVPSPLLRRQRCRLAIDGETVLDGWIDHIGGSWQDSQLDAQVAGRDKTCDLADCAAAPNGPAEWRNATLLQIAQQICAPFGITVRAETDIGAPFPRLAISPHETALSLLEKAARQRGVLVVSDGVGGLLLTTGGHSPAPADIRVGVNAQCTRFSYDDRRRYSDIYVKGQSEKAAGHRGGGAPRLTHAYSPAALSIPPTAQTIEAAGILITGHATDPEVTRWRPSVRLTRTQSGGATAQMQAEWAVRVARGASEELLYTVLDWRAGGVLWRPNTVVRVVDPYAGIDDRMLIRSVTYRIGPDGPAPYTPVTEIGVVGLTAFDRINDATPKRPIRPKASAP